MSAVLAVRIEPERTYEASVRALLKEWASYRRGWSPHIGYRGAVSWLDQIKGCVDSYAEAEDYDRRILAAEMRHVDEAVRALSANHQHAIGVVYLNEAGPAVWRSAKKPMTEIRALCDEAERLLVPALRKRDVVL